MRFASAGSTMRRPFSMFMPQRNGYSPGVLGVNSTVVVWNAGRAWLMPNASKTTRSEQSAVSSR